MAIAYYLSMARNLLEENHMSDNVSAVRTFIIPDQNMGDFRTRLDKLIKRAHKLQVTPPSYTVVKEETQTIQVVMGQEEDDYGCRKDIMGDKISLLHHIILHSAQVVVAGHEFCATIQHTEDGNILHCRKGFTVPLMYRDCNSYCDHCKTMRRRNDTFIVRHVEHNTYMQVGRNCLADFLGRDAERYASAAELYYEIDELAEASENVGEGGWSRGTQYDYLDRYLGYVAECIMLKGWRSRSTAKEYGGQATADIAYLHTSPTSEFLKYGEVLFRTPSDKSVEVAKAAIAWCEALTDAEVEPSDYLHNIRLIARRGIVGAKQYGFAASIVSGYQRAIGELVRKERNLQDAITSQYVGEVGERSKFTLMVDHVVSLPDYGYGESSLHLMSDRRGNRFTWKSSSHTLDKGKEVLLKGTIKAHTTYKEVKQTVLSRCQELELHNYIYTIGTTVYEVPAESEKAARKMLLETIYLTKLPKGTTCVEKAPEVVTQESNVIVTPTKEGV